MVRVDLQSELPRFRLCETERGWCTLLRAIREAGFLGQLFRR